MQKKVLLVGGGGFIGSHIIRELVSSDRDLVVLDTAGPPDEFRSVPWFVGSFFDDALIASIVSDCDSVIFLANMSLPGSSNSNLFVEARDHVAATIRVAELCVKFAVQSFVFSSSGGTVYGYDSPLGGSREDSWTCPNNGYGVSKLCIENYLRLLEANSEMKVVSLRLSNPYGEGQNAVRGQGLIASAFMHALEGTALPVWGDGTVSRDFVYVKDVARAFVLALDYQGSQTVMNIGSGASKSVNFVVDAVRRVSGLQLEVEYSRERKIDVGINYLNIERAVSELGWMPEVEFDCGLVKTFDWWKKCRGL